MTDRKPIIDGAVLQPDCWPFQRHWKMAFKQKCWCISPLLPLFHSSRCSYIKRKTLLIHYLHFPLPNVELKKPIQCFYLHGTTRPLGTSFTTGYPSRHKLPYLSLQRACRTDIKYVKVSSRICIFSFKPQRTGFKWCHNSRKISSNVKCVILSHYVCINVIIVRSRKIFPLTHQRREYVTPGVGVF